MKLERRPYEENAVRDLCLLLPEHRRVLVVAPTGSGKTVIASMLLTHERRRWRKVLWLAHRHELVDQAYQTLVALGVRAGVIMAQDERLHGSDRVDPDARVQVSSVQTASSRCVTDEIDFDFIVFDEAHRVMADSYQRIAIALPNAEVVGLTATPCRMDNRGLGDFFNHLLVVAKPSELYADGYLAKPRTFSAPPEVLSLIARGLAGAQTSFGDFTPGSVARAVDQGHLIGKVVSESLRIAPDVPKVVFAGGVEHSKKLTTKFRRRGIRVAHLDSATPPETRQEILGGLRDGDLEVVCNVDVLGEGWDLPALGAVVLARPTKSLVRYLQMTGRVQRTFHRKRPIVIDHGANVQRFDLLPGSDVDWTLERGSDRANPDPDDPRVRTCESCNAALEWSDRFCSECGAAQADRKTPRQERRELAVRLEEVERTRLGELRARIESVARQKGASREWTERLFREVTAR